MAKTGTQGPAGQSGNPASPHPGRVFEGLAENLAATDRENNGAGIDNLKAVLKNTPPLKTKARPGHANLGPISPEGEAWYKRSTKLVEWVTDHLINRVDVYGRYAADGGQFTAKDGLTPKVLDRHFRPITAADIIGLHTTTAEEVDGPDGPVVSSTCRWVTNDIDHHAEGSPAPDINERAAKTWHARVVDLGFRPLTLESNGNGEFRVFLLFSEPIQSDLAYHLIRWLQRDWAELGFAKPPECFPKQERIGLLIKGADRWENCGSWVRLFGRHHKRDHYTRFWDGARWLEGAEAVEYLLDHGGDDPALIPLEVHELVKAARANRKPEPPAAEGGSDAGEKTPDDFLLAAEALRYVRARARSYKTWVDVGMALHCLGDRGLVLWDEWSKTSPENYEPGACAAKWATFSDNGLRLGSLFHWAAEAGWKYPAVVGLEWPAAGSVGSVAVGSEVAPIFQGDPRPISANLLPVPTLDPAMIPGPFRDWLHDIAIRGCFPIEYATAAALVGLSGLIGKRLAIRRHDDWLVVPNLWGAAVGPPGIQKTPAVDEGLRPLNRLAAEAFDAHDANLQTYLQTAMIGDAKRAAAKKALEAAAKGKKSDAELAKLAAEATAGGGAADPVPKRYLVNDATVEKLGELLAENPTGLVQFRDELTGFLRAMDRQGHESDRGFYLESWNGFNSYVYDRIGRGTVVIPNVCLSIFGTIQPGPLSRYLRRSISGAEADGFVPRFQLMVYPDPPAAFVNVDRYLDTQAKTTAFAVFQAIDSLDPAARGCPLDQDRNISYLGFCREAQEFFDGWRAHLENRLLAGGETPLMAATLSKYRSLMPSLALIFHLIAQAQNPIIDPVSLEAAAMAAAWCDLLEAHSRRVYQSAMDGDPETALHLAERIKQSLPNPFTYREVAKKGWSGLTTSEEVAQAVGILEDRNWVKVVEIPPGPKGGRPSQQVWINPVLLSAAASTGGPP